MADTSPASTIGYGSLDYGGPPLYGYMSTNTQTLEITNAGGASTQYSITVNGTVDWNTDLGTVQPNDSIEGQTVSGAVNGGIDAFDFTGDITAASFSGMPPTIKLNGLTVSLAELQNTMTQTAQITLTLEHEGEIIVTATETDGTPLGGVSITITGDSGQEWVGSTGTDGTASFGGLTISEYTVDALKAGYFPASETITPDSFTDSDG